MLLEPADRSAALPPETAEKPLLVWVKGFAHRRGGYRRRGHRRDDDGAARDGEALRDQPGLLPHLRQAGAGAVSRRGRATCALGCAAYRTRRVSEMASRFDEVMARKGEIMVRALGMDYREFERRPIAFDYDAMMAAHGYSLDDIVAIQRAGGVGEHAAARAAQPHRPRALHRRARAWAAASSSRTRPRTWPARSRTAGPA